jgi:hypothetical protein
MRWKQMQNGFDETARYAAVMQACRALERHAAALRGELLWLAGGEGGRLRVDRALDKLQAQLLRANSLADELAAANDDGARDAA